MLLAGKGRRRVLRAQGYKGLSVHGSVSGGQDPAGSYFRGVIMSFCRWSEGDLYIYDDVRGFFNCMHCPLNKPGDDGLRDDTHCDTPQELLKHVKEHQKAGHKAPYSSILRRIQEEIQSRCHWVIDRGYHAGTQCGQNTVGKVGKAHLCSVHLGIASTQPTCKSTKHPECISRHGTWRSRHRPPRCRICGKEV